MTSLITIRASAYLFRSSQMIRLLIAAVLEIAALVIAIYTSTRTFRSAFEIDMSSEVSKLNIQMSYLNVTYERLSDTVDDLAHLFAVEKLELNMTRSTIEKYSGYDYQDMTTELSGGISSEWNIHDIRDAYTRNVLSLEALQQARCSMNRIAYNILTLYDYQDELTQLDADYKSWNC